jgi:hypothetical protein
MPNIRAALADYRHVTERILTEFPDEDEDSLRDTILGETYLDDAIASLLRQSDVIEARANGLAELLAKWSSRIKQQLERAEKLRAVALWATQEAGWKKIEAPDFTRSIVTPKHGKVITPSGVAGLPREYVKQKIDEFPDKKAIRAALERGEEVGDSYFGNPQPHWIRR